MGGGWQRDLPLEDANARDYSPKSMIRYTKPVTEPDTGEVQ
jgi:hypothetical protein